MDAIIRILQGLPDRCTDKKEDVHEDINKNSQERDAECKRHLTIMYNMVFLELCLSKIAHDETNFKSIFSTSRLTLEQISKLYDDEYKRFCSKVPNCTIPINEDINNFGELLDKITRYEHDLHLVPEDMATLRKYREYADVCKIV